MLYGSVLRLGQIALVSNVFEDFRLSSPLVKTPLAKGLNLV